MVVLVVVARKVGSLWLSNYPLGYPMPYAPDGCRTSTQSGRPTASSSVGNQDANGKDDKNCSIHHFGLKYVISISKLIKYFHSLATLYALWVVSPLLQPAC
jgi:hypothetical protein